MSLQISTHKSTNPDLAGYVSVRGKGVEVDISFGEGYGNTQADAERQACEFAAAADMLAELKAAHLIIRNALNLMDIDQKFAWGEKNAAAGVDGFGVTRANEREAVIAKAEGNQ